MTDDMTNSPGEPGSSGSASPPGSTDEPFWQEPAAPKTESREWVVQLQTMIEQLTTQAAPVIREVGAKAAELAALAGEKAGPVAHRAAALTSDAGMKLAERSRTFAAEIRRDQAARGEGPAPSIERPATDSDSADEPTTTGVA
jgi:hypothetical protein